MCFKKGYQIGHFESYSTKNGKYGRTKKIIKSSSN